MSDDNAKELIKLGSARFSARQQLDSLRQEIALNFDPKLAYFTDELTLGDDYARHLVDSTPLMVARDFIGQLGAMLRPPGKQYFWHRTPIDEINNDVAVRDYQDWRSRQQLRIMFDRVTGAHRAHKVADKFFALFGEAVMSIDLSRDQSSLRMGAYHIKDVVFALGDENEVDRITRKERVPSRVMKMRFGEDKLHRKVKEACEKHPDQTFEIRHEVLPAEEYDAYFRKQRPRSREEREKQKYVSVWVDVEHQTILRETWQRTKRYVIPRWETFAQWSHGSSPATTTGLPDARLLQSQAGAILEAAEKQINPPLIAYSDAIRGDVSLIGGDITWVEDGYDDRTGQPVMPLELGKNFGLGVDSLLRTQDQLAKAFYLDKLHMPDTRNSKSTLEVQFLIDEFVRAALPLFAPIQSEYNDAVLFEADEIIELAGGYAEREKPEALRDMDTTFSWDNPLSDMIERQKAQRVGELAQVAQTVAGIEAAAAQSPSLQQTDNAKLYREAVMGIGAAEWLVDEDEAAANKQAGEEVNQQLLMAEKAPDIAKLIESGVGAAESAASIPVEDTGVPLLPAVE